MATQTTWGPLKALMERFDEHNFGRTEVQRLVENADVLVQIGNGTLTRDIISQIIEQVVNPFASEKVNPIRAYPEGWQQFVPEKQVASLNELYADLDSSHVDEIAAGIEVPEGADGLFVIPKLSVIATRLGIEDPYGAGYGQLLESTVLAHLANTRKFHNYRAGELTSDRVRMRQSAADALRKLEDSQPGDFIVIAAQTGKKWAGFSPRNARWEIERKSENEFPLPAWVVGHILLTNPQRLDQYGVLWIDCPGDEYRFGADAEFGLCLYFYFCDGQLKFGSRWLGSALGRLRFRVWLLRVVSILGV